MNITVMNEPARELGRYQISENRVKVMMTQNLCVWHYIITTVSLPKDPPKPPRDFPVARLCRMSDKFKKFGLVK